MKMTSHLKKKATKGRSNHCFTLLFLLGAIFMAANLFEWKQQPLLNWQVKSDIPQANVHNLQLKRLDRTNAKVEKIANSLIGEVNSRLQDFAMDSKFNQTLRNVFTNTSSVTKTTDELEEQLRKQILNNTLNIQIEILTDKEMQGHPAAYTCCSADGTEKIYLNAYWLGSELMYSYLLNDLIHEVGHAIDHRLNTYDQSIGDKGELFARTIGGAPLSMEEIALIRNRESRSKIWLEGVQTEVECATVTFLKVYAATGSAYKINDLKINITTPISGSSFMFTSSNPADVQFAGNNVTGQLTYLSGGQTYTVNGTITGKTGNPTAAFCFFETTLLGSNTATGNAYVFLIPGSSIVENSQVSFNSSSPATDLNTFLATQQSNVDPVISSNGGGSTAAITIPENSTAVTTVTATDANVGDTKSFSITGGADAARFAINATTGVLSFLSAPNYESPADAGLNNVYDVQVTVTDSQGATDIQDIAVSVSNVNDVAPLITSNGGGDNAAIPVTQGTTAVTTVSATDGDGSSLTYSISGGAQAAYFIINSSTGVLSFQNASVNGTYVVSVTVSDGTFSDIQTITVTVSTTDTTPPTLVITSSDSNLSLNEVCTISFKFSEQVQDFAIGSISVTGGSLSSFVHSLSDLTLYTVQFTKNSDRIAPSFIVAGTSYRDLASSPNQGSTTSSLTLLYDIDAPTVNITAVDNQMAYGESQIVTFTFSENPGITFSAADLTVNYGSLTNLLQSGTPTVWTASIKATNAINGPTITVIDKSYLDAAGNAGSTASKSFILAAPSIGLASTPASDTGTLSNDNITTNRKPVIVGLAPANTTVTVVVNDGTSHSYSVSVPGSGSWSLDLSVVAGTPALASVGLAEGYIGLSITTGGGATASSSFLLDISAPATPTITAQSTTDSTPTIGGTVTIGEFDTFTVLLNSVTYTVGDGNLSYNAGAGTWSLTVPDANTLSAGTYSVTTTMTDAAGNVSSATNGSAVIINLPTSITVQPASPATVNSGNGTAAISVTATGTNLTYQWYVDVNSLLSNSAPYSGVTSSTLTITNPTTALHNKQYTVKVTGDGGIETSNAATLTVNTVTGGTIAGGNQTIPYLGDPAAFTVSTAATGNGTLSYQWQSSTTNASSGFGDIALNATSATYDAPSGLAQTTWYKRITTSTLNGVSCTAESNVLLVTVGKTFVPSGSSLWNSDANWVPTGVPSSTEDIFITTTCTISGTTASCKNIAVLTGGTLIIASDGALSISGTLTNNVTEGVVIQSNASGTGSLIVHAVTGTGSVASNRWLTSGSWHLVSSSVVESVAAFLTANAAIPTNGSSQRGMMDYNPTTNGWNTFFTTGASNGSAGSGRGFCLRVGASDAAITFSGSLQYGDQTASSLTSEKWNCVGNPYSSAIGVNSSSSSGATNNFLSVNSANLDPANGAIYIWEQPDASNGLTGKYTTVSNSSGGLDLQQGQAFMVKMKSGVSSLAFTSAMQFHSPSLSLKSTSNVWPSIQLMATMNKQTNSTLIAFHSGMTKGLDPTFDAGLLKGGTDLLIYTKLVEDYGIPFAIQALPENNWDQMAIPVGLDFKTGGEVTFSAKTSYLPSDCRLILEDKLTRTFTDLATGTYKAAILPNSSLPDRFLLHTSTATISAIGQTILAGKLFAYLNNSKEIRIEGKVSGQAIATLYDVQGRTLLNQRLEEANLNVIPASAIAQGIYLLTVEDQGTKQTFKLFIKQ